MDPSKPPQKGKGNSKRRASPLLPPTASQMAVAEPRRPSLEEFCIFTTCLSLSRDRS